jgi:hypothetical protein
MIPFYLPIVAHRHPAAKEKGAGAAAICRRPADQPVRLAPAPAPILPAGLGSGA